VAEKVTSSGKPKHAQLTRPLYGQFGRTELAILGTPCGEIKQLAFSVIERLSSTYALAYVDADHKSADAEAAGGKDTSSALSYGADLEFTDKITFSRLDYRQAPNAYQLKPLFNAQDLVLVNGNHFFAQAQIVVIDPKKPLEKKLDKLTNIRLILLQDGVDSVPEFIKKHIKDYSGQPPVYSLRDTDKIAAFVAGFIQGFTPAVYGLVLAGGRSTRMGQDKGQLNYHGQDQRTYTYELLKPFCTEVHLSCRADQEAELSAHFHTLPDTFVGLGPMGAILSAFRHNPNVAWLVLACDLPFLSGKSLRFLLEGRNPSKTATTFQSPENDFPEPLITIWEPKSYPVLLQFLSMGYSCPRKALINSDCRILPPPDVQELANINHPEEYAEALRKIKNSGQ
jgi:molybdenum cofactor guanylyltransferase